MIISRRHPENSNSHFTKFGFDSHDDENPIGHVGGAFLPLVKQEALEESDMLLG